MDPSLIEQAYILSEKYPKIKETIEEYKRESGEYMRK